MKRDDSLWNIFGKWQYEENLLWNTFMNQLRDVSESETFIVVRVTNKSTTLAVQLFQHGQTFVDK